MTRLESETGNPLATQEPATANPSQQQGENKRLSLRDFARKIKDTYPTVYDDLSDDDLARRVIKKYPVYSDMVDLSEITNAARSAAAPDKIPMSSFERQMHEALQPTSGQVQVGIPATQRLLENLDIEISPELDIPTGEGDKTNLNLDTLFDFGAIPLDDPSFSDDQLLDLLDKRISGALGIDPKGRKQLREMGLDPFYGMDRTVFANQLRGAMAQAKSTGGNKFTVPLTQSWGAVAEAYKQGGVAAAYEMGQQLAAEDAKVKASIHTLDPTPNPNYAYEMKTYGVSREYLDPEVDKIMQARRAVSLKLGMAQATVAQNEFWSNLLSMGNPMQMGRLGGANIIPGTSEAKTALAQFSPYQQQFYKDQAVADAVIEVLPSTVLQTTRMLAMAGAGSALASTAGAVGPVVGSIVGVQADTAIQHFDKPLTEQATHQLITLAMTGAGVSAGVARNLLAAKGFYVPTVLYAGVEGGAMALGTLGAMEALTPEASFQQKLANTLVAGVLPLGFAAARGLSNRPVKEPAPAPPTPEAPKQLTAGSPLLELQETFPIYENKYKDSYVVNLSRPGEESLGLPYSPGEQIPLFDAVIGGQRARTQLAKGLATLSPEQLTEAYRMAGGMEHALPSPEELPSTILDLLSSKLPLMEATTENRAQVLEAWSGIERQDTLLETPFQFGKTYQVVEEAPNYYKLRDLNEPNQVFRIHKLSPAGLTAKLETVSSINGYSYTKNLVIPDPLLGEATTQPLLFPEPQATELPQQPTGTITTNREGAIARLQLLLDYQQSPEYKTLSKAARTKIAAEADQLRKDISLPSGGRYQLFVPRPEAAQHLDNLVAYSKRAEFAQLPSEYQQLIKQEIADLDFLLTRAAEDPARQAALYKGITTEESSPRNRFDRAVNQVGAEGPKLLPPGRYELPAPPPEPKLPVRPMADFEQPPAGEELGRIPIAEATREVPQLRADWAEYDTQLEVFKRTPEYQRLTWREKEQLEPDTQRVPLPKRLSESQVGRGRISKVPSTKVERGWTIKAPKEGKSKVYKQLLDERARLEQQEVEAVELARVEETTTALPEPSPLAQELQLPAPSSEVVSLPPSGDTIPINKNTSMFAARALLREFAARQEQKNERRAALGKLPSVSIPDPDNNPLWQMIKNLPVEELRAQLTEEGVDVGKLKSKALLQKALYKYLAPEAEPEPTLRAGELERFATKEKELQRTPEEIEATLLEKLRRETNNPELTLEQVVADPTKFETALMDAMLSPREQERVGWQDTRDMSQLRAIEDAISNANPDEPSWVTTSRNNLKGTTLNALGGQTLYDWAVVHVYDHIWKPGMRYAEFAKQVIEQLGDEYSHYLGDLWDHFTSQATTRRNTLADAMRGVEAKAKLRRQTTQDLAKQKPAALRALFDALGVVPPEALPERGGLTEFQESHQLATELNNIISGMQKLGAKSVAEAQAKVAELPDDPTARTIQLSPAELLALKKAEVASPGVISFLSSPKEQLIEPDLDGLVAAVDRIMVNRRAASKLTQARSQAEVIAEKLAKVKSATLDEKLINPEDWLRGLDITPEEVAQRVEKLQASSRIITHESYAAAKAELRKTLSQFNTGLDPRTLRMMATVMAYHVENGARRYGAFAAKAVDEFGDAARSNMAELFEETQRYVQLYAKSPLLAKVMEKSPSAGLGSLLARVSIPAFSAIDTMRKVFSLANRSPEAREVADLLSRADSVSARNMDILRAQLGVLHAWAEGGIYWGGKGSKLSPGNYRRSELATKKLRMELNFALDEGAETKLLTDIDAPNDVKVAIAEMRKILAQKRDEIRKIAPGALEVVADNYFPRIYKYGKAFVSSNFANARAGRPLETRKTFLKGRKLDSMRQAVEELGFELESENFVDNFLYKVTEMEKFIQMHKTIDAMRARGWEKVENRAKIPEGWAMLNDPISNMLKKVHKSDGTFEYRDQGTVRVYPQTIADLINNKLKPSLHNIPAFRAWNTFTNFANQYQLFGLFHLGLVMTDANTRLPAIGAKGMFWDAWQHLYHGEREVAMRVMKESAKSFVRGVFAPVGMGAVMYQGTKMLREWRAPGSQGGEYTKRVGLLQEGGVQAFMEGHMEKSAVAGIIRNYKNILEVLGSTDPPTRKALEVMKESTGALSKIPLVPIQAIMQPMMQEIVPRAKLGVEYYLAGYELSRLNGPVKAKELRRTMAKVRDVVDDTLGQLNYGNLHMNKPMTEFVMSTVRALGFQVGSERTLYAPVLESAKFAKDLATPGARAELTHRMAYMGFGLPFGIMTMHFIAQAIATKYNTGKVADFTPKDAVAPRTGLLDANGDEERFYLVNYFTKEFYPIASRLMEGRVSAAAHTQAEMFSHKLNPGINQIMEIWNNKDFYGEWVVDPNSDKRALTQYGDYALDQLLPFFLRNAERAEALGKTGFMSKYGSFFSITPAPQYINATTAEDVMMGILKEHYPKAGRSEGDIERGLLRKKFTNQWRQAVLVGDEKIQEDLENEMNAAYEAGKLTTRDLDVIYKGVDKTRTLELFQRLSQQNLQDALRVWESWMSPEEQQLVLPELVKAYGRIANMALPPEKKEQLYARLEKIIDANGGVGGIVPDEQQQPPPQ